MGVTYIVWTVGDVPQFWGSIFIQAQIFGIDFGPKPRCLVDVLPRARFLGLIFHLRNILWSGLREIIFLGLYLCYIPRFLGSNFSY